jgi:hypothetical protein
MQVQLNYCLLPTRLMYVISPLVPVCVPVLHVGTTVHIEHGLRKIIGLLDRDFLPSIPWRNIQGDVRAKQRPCCIVGWD